MYNALNPELLIDTLFNVASYTEFERAALTIFNVQVRENIVYRDFVEGLKLDPEKVTSVDKIPFLPIDFFKTHKIISGKGNVEKIEQVFTSSGAVQSRHYVKELAVYEKSYREGFKHIYGPVENYCVLALLPSYLEREGSSLIYMADDLIKRSGHPMSGFYLNNYDDLIQKLELLEAKGQKVLLLGVTYALLELAEMHKFKLKHTTIMETGGMKGKRREMVREELHAVLCNSFGVNVIHSEYGMTELLSQAYSKGNGVFYCPPWMTVMIRDTNDPFACMSDSRTGGVNVIDLANIYSCSFIATQDLGKRYPDGSFEILGRFDNSDLRGCNLLVG